jgi:putative ABC transport system permease protein
MKSYLSLIPISAKVHRRQNRMTLLCIVFAVFMVTAVFSMAEMGFRMEQARLVGKHGSFSIGDLLGSSMGQTLLSVAVVLFLLILVAGVLMISNKDTAGNAKNTDTKEGNIRKFFSNYKTQYRTQPPCCNNP